MRGKDCLHRNGLMRGLAEQILRAVVHIKTYGSRVIALAKNATDLGLEIAVILRQNSRIADLWPNDGLQCHQSISSSWLEQ